MCQQIKEGNKNTLCWRCQNALGRCPWSESFKPVPGWKAEATIVKSYCDKGRFVYQKSFNVIECPMFEKDNAESFKEMANRLGIGKRDLIEKLKILRGIEDGDLL